MCLIYNYCTHSGYHRRKCFDNDKMQGRFLQPTMITIPAKEQAPLGTAAPPQKRVIGPRILYKSCRIGCTGGGEVLLNWLAGLALTDIPWLV